MFQLLKLIRIQWAIMKLYPQRSGEGSNPMINKSQSYNGASLNNRLHQFENLCFHVQFGNNNHLSYLESLPSLIHPILDQRIKRGHEEMTRWLQKNKHAHACGYIGNFFINPRSLCSSKYSYKYETRNFLLWWKITYYGLFYKFQRSLSNSAGNPESILKLSMEKYNSRWHGFQSLDDILIMFL
jgi:hypothetical protein